MIYKGKEWNGHVPRENRLKLIIIIIIITIIIIIDFDIGPIHCCSKCFTKRK